MSVQEATEKLKEIARELDQLSRDLADLERSREPIDREVKDFIRDFELGLYHRSINEGSKMPAERIRDALALQAISPPLYGKWMAMNSSRDRMRQRISDLKSESDSWRSVVSALKVELEATR